MWQALKTLIALVEKGFGIFERQRSYLNERKKADIGYDLFMLYSRANEVLVVGDKIVRALREFVDIEESSFPSSFEDIPSTKYSPVVCRGKNFGMSLQDLISSQIQSISLTRDRMSYLADELKIFDADFYRIALIAFDEKEGELGRLLGVMYGGFIPVNDFQFTSTEELMEKKPNEFLPSHLAFDRNLQSIISDYLSHTNPEKALESIESSLSDLRDKLEENFTLVEILGRVRDERVRIRSEMENRWRLRRLRQSRRHDS